MAMRLFNNAFSPFARKVRLVLDYKGIDYEIIDGLDKSNAEPLEQVNGRAEVPTLVDGEVTVVNSADIAAYLEHAYPEPAVYPADPAMRVQARAWERCADAVIDPILVDISYWFWADRADTMPDGMKQAAQNDLDRIYDALERDLDGGDFICGEFSIADIALFPHLTAVRTLDVSFSRQRHPRLAIRFKRLRGLDAFRNDLERTRDYVADLDERNIEREKIFWRGDRVEWLMARGYHDWFLKEIAEERVIWPGLGVPAQRT